MVFSVIRLFCVVAALAVTTPVFAQAKGYTVTWSVTMNQVGEISDSDGGKAVVTPKRTYKATEKIGPLKKGGMPLADMESLQNNPMAAMKYLQDYQAAVGTISDNTPIIQFSINDHFIASSTTKGEGGVATTDGTEGTIVGSGTTTYKSAGNTRTTLGYSVSKKEYELWLPFYVLHNAPKVASEYHNYSIGSDGVKKTKMDSGMKAQVDATGSAVFRAVDEKKKIWPVLKIKGPMPLRIQETMKIMYLLPGDSTAVPVNIVINATVTPIK
jgi:hypothetical protein